MYPDKYHFIAIFEYTKSEDDNDIIGVYFPDLPGCISCGDNTENAVEMAKEALSLHLYGMESDGDEIPVPSEISKIEFDKNEIPMLIEVYMKPFREKMNTKYIKKTLSIPNWLNTAAEAQHINFSAVLQEGLLHILNN